VPSKPLTVAWIVDFPIEWLKDVPEPLRHLPRRHPATWEIVLLEEFEKNPEIRLHIILLRGRISESFSFDRNGVIFHVLKATPIARLSSFFWIDTFLIRKTLNDFEPDLVHAWGTEKGAALIGSRLRRPYLMTVQGLYGWYKQRVRLGPYDRYMELLERICLRRAPLVTTESRFAVSFLKQRLPKLRIHQAEHAPRWEFHRVQRQPSTDPIQFISVGSLGERKGTDLIFRALDQLTNELYFRLTIVSGPNAGYLEEMRKIVSQNFWQRIEFHHHILPHEVARQLERPTLFLLPTRADTSPNAVKEAVVAGVPVIASNVGGIPDYVFPNQNGVLFEPGDLAGFVSAIRLGCQHPLFSQGQVDPETLAQTRDYLSPARMAKNFLAAYREALV
jgi:glycosyltransferase involved in cell wall biosynthesis